MAKYKLVEKLDHIYTENIIGQSLDWYLLKCGHVVCRKNTDMSRKRCRCYFCCGKPFFHSPVPMVMEIREIHKDVIPSLESLLEAS